MPKGKNLSIFLLSLLFLPSCITLDKERIQASAFLSPRLSGPDPAIELFDLRVDVIRPSTDCSDGDDDCDKPYHPLGFRLGGGLFYDLNGNLGFLLTDLLDLQKNDSFRLLEVSETNNFLVRYAYTGDAYRREYRGLIPYTREDQISKEDGYLLYRKNFLTTLRFRETPDTLEYNTGLFARRIIREGKGFTVPGVFRDQRYIEQSGIIQLDNNYWLRKSGDQLRIYASRRAMEKDRPYRIIQWTDNEIIFRNRNWFGGRLVFNEGGLSLYRNRRLLKSWEKLN